MGYTIIKCVNLPRLTRWIMFNTEETIIIVICSSVHLMPLKTELRGCTALGTERGYLLINGNIITRACRGDTVHGPLLYLWRGENADVELEGTGQGSDYTVHALATISGRNHRVKLTRWEAEGQAPRLPIMLGYGMPRHAEMSTPILEEEASNITLINQTGMPVIKSDRVIEGK